ncbi:unnamed protein product [Fraxinus pennsylvanica]|uniref:UDP-N-acetylmuramate dehydrogenase n=1 Tax=Fraxinus pennsylvanica TaxID=56036 RepID=A0AAD1ZF11_9LAMI|nr:unnamed protein product [Fraxinus pennsylvanica]
MARQEGNFNDAERGIPALWAAVQTQNQRFEGIEKLLQEIQRTIANVNVGGNGNHVNRRDQEEENLNQPRGNNNLMRRQRNQAIDDSSSDEEHSNFLPRPPRKPIYFSCRSSGINSFNDKKWRTKLIRGQILLKNLSTWGIGGPCKYFVQVFEQTQLISAIRYCNEHSIRFMIIGKGSNCLFDDVGFDGCIVLNCIESLETIEPGLYRVGSGYPFNRLGMQCATEGFTGLEFAGGIPGTVGGAAYMNAGANGQETADSIDCVEIITSEGEHQMLKKSDLAFGYRSSPFQNMEDFAAITAVTFRLEFSESARRQQQEDLKRRKFTQPVGESMETADSIDCVEIITSEGEHQMLKKSDLAFGYRSSPFQNMEDFAAITAVTFRLEFSESARRQQQEYLKRRQFTQPVGEIWERSAGSVFRNPSDSKISAAEFIERAGLKGYRIGGAMVSKKHANFFINCGGATSQEMLELIRLVKGTVFEGFGVELKEEILYVPFCKDKIPNRDSKTSFEK